MSITELKVTRIGNSRGVRLPAATLKRYRIGDALLMEEKSDGIVLRPFGLAVAKLSWADTAHEMATAGEDWRAWDRTDNDGLAGVPWDAPLQKVAERRPHWGTRAPPRQPS
jgi:antitoxin component of MazEF toxin-antitoxin module